MTAEAGKPEASGQPAAEKAADNEHKDEPALAESAPDQENAQEPEENQPAAETADNAKPADDDN